ncbi:MAG: HNH endonuclease signature motif containing protein [Bacteroidota bacterium]
MASKYIPESTKQEVIERAFGKCEYCLSWMHNAIHTFHIEHIRPFHLSEDSSIENLALSCGGCNSFKSIKTSAIDPVTKELVSLFNPRKHEWKEHFTWSDDYLQVIGITPIGRATVEILRLNRTGLINLRRLTILSGEHPPKDA